MNQSSSSRCCCRKPQNQTGSVFAWWLVLLFLLGIIHSGRAATSVTFEAEAGTLGADFTNGVSGPTQFISIASPNVNSGNPGTNSRVATYSVTFPVPGIYQLYARVRVGTGGANDDSLFYGASFGVKSATNTADWFTINGIGGFSTSTDVVTGGGTTTSGVWKWINLSQKSGEMGFIVSAGGLTQTLQIGAREDGLDLDKFGFGMYGVAYTVADLDGGLDGTMPPDGNATINWSDTRQMIDGFGAGVVFLNGGAVFNDANADKLFKSDNIGQLALTLLRVRIEPNNTWTNSVSAWNGSLNDAKRAATRGAGVLASPWTPPAAMKTSTNNVGGSLLADQYANYASYLEKYASNMLANGVSLRAVSVQNEPDWDPDYEGCVWNGAQLLNFFRTNAGVIHSAPVMMPESLGFNFGLSDPALNDSIAVTNIDFIGGHLYGVATVNGFRNIPSYNNALAKGKRVWQTEYLINDQTTETAMLTAKEIHNCLTAGNMSAYIWWKCVSTQNGLLNDAGVIQKRGYMMSQFSRFVRPGDYRLGETNLTASSTVSAYKNLTNNQFAIIAVNTYSFGLSQTINLTNFPSPVTLVPWITSATQSLATLPAINVTNGTFNFSLPPTSIVTFVGQAVFGPPGVAGNPAPTNGAAGVAVGSALSWTPGSNAVSHAVYLGTSSNAVALATSSAPEFQGVLPTPTFTPGLNAYQTYFWRVDEIAGANTNTGVVWSFSTVPAPALAHRYSFGETGGTTVVDSEGGAAWNGTVFNGGTLAGGQLTLASASSQYVSLPPGIVSTLSNFTITAWVRLNSAAGWARIFDFGNNTTTYMFLTPTNGGTGGRLRFGITTNSAGGEQQITGPTALSVGVWHHVAVTLSGNTGILYLNGVPQATNASITLKPFHLGNTVNNYLGRSQWADPYLNGQLDELRIYSVTHSAAEISAMAALGPNQLLSNDSPPLGLATTPTTLTLTWPLASAGFMLQLRTNLALGNWANVAVPAPQIIGGQWQVTLPPPVGSGAMYYRLMK